MKRLQPRTLLVIVLVGASLGLLVFGGAAWVAPMREALQTPLAILQRAVAGAWDRIAGNLQPDPTLEALQQQVSQLEAENTRLLAENVQLRESESQLRILSGLVEYARSQPDAKYLTANLIGRDTSPLLTTLIFDRGSDDGVIRGMPVVTGAGLVGRVVEVSPQACKVQPLTDPASAIAARLQASRETGVVVGQLGGGLEMQFITQQTRVSPGELVLTSGLGGEYPAGIVLGTVSAVQQLDYEVLQKAEVTPAVDVNRLEIVLIITNFTPVDLSPFFRTTPTPAPVPAP
ncbi:MAG: rod shape-determining protein MreC [Anaerolineales bacterium]|nr:rod shape-determining protein MreC [Anaerolineales bacterium]